ncbi:MAG: hypothetical protein HPY66_2658 [Firmicutes bacterium]|nr:hypothetical protein [Bacillota bacterium]MDI6706777.1 RNA-binding S4 domain-containing protein [Bacillota bacterium]
MEIKIKGDYITLSQILKLSGAASTGGEAKFMILDGRVRVNGRIVNQRNMKIFSGDIVEVDDGVRIKAL